MTNDMIDVLVVGAGPVGLLLAGELARHGLAVRLVDQNEAATDKSKAIGVHARTLEIFADLGVVDEALAAGRRAHGAHLRSRHAGEVRELARVTFDGIDSPFPMLLLLPQYETERILDALARRRGVAVERRTKLVALREMSDKIVATVEKDGVQGTIEARYVVGCDGAHSSVRHLTGVEFEGAAMPETFLLADVDADLPLDRDEASLFLADDGVFAAFPFPGPSRWRIISDVPTGPDAGDTPLAMLPAPSLAEVQALLDARTSGGTVRGAHWLSRFRISDRLARRYRVGRAFLAGDAAHIHSPVGGQGMNTGIQDAYNLGWKLALVVRGHARDGLLDSYERERRPVAAALLRATGALTRTGLLKLPLLRDLRDFAIRFATGLGPVRARIATDASEIDIAYKDSPIVDEAGHFDGGPAAGERLPDAVLGDGTHLHARVGQARHTLLVVGNVDPAGYDPGGHIAVVPVDGDAVKARLGVRTRALYLVRPDGYVAYRTTDPDPASVRDFLGRAY